MKNALIIFARPPIAGHAKTRLIPALGAEGAAAFHEELMINTLKNTVQNTRWNTYLWCASQPNLPVFQHCREYYGVTLKQQADGNLGQRMYAALAQTLKHYERVIIIGTDCPLLDEAIIENAFESLQQEEDVLIIPAEDGGYVLLGLKNVESGLFNGIGWGDNSVFQKSLDNINKLGLNPVIKSTLWDIDEPEDLKRYQALASVCPPVLVGDSTP